MAVMSLGHSIEYIVPKVNRMSEWHLSPNDSEINHSQNSFNEHTFICLFFYTRCACEGSEQSLPFPEGQILHFCSHQVTPTICVYVELQYPDRQTDTTFLSCVLN